MKIMVAFLAALVLILAATVLWLAPQRLGSRLTTDDVAVALGLKHWHYQVPASLSPNDNLVLEVVTPEGFQRSSGGSSGWKPGEVVTIFMVPTDDGSRVRWTIANQARTTTVFWSDDNPISGRLTKQRNPRDVGDDGVLIKSAEEGPLGWHVTNPTEVAIRIAIESREKTGSGTDRN